MNLPLVSNDGAVACLVHEPTCAPWVQTCHGAAVDLLDPDPATIHLQDIAVALARTPRFNGHTIDVFSVAQHSTLVLEILSETVPLSSACNTRLGLAALLHDAHEAYMGDITMPVASVPGMAEPIRAMKARLQRAIHIRFGLPEALPESWRAAIAHADRVALATEKRDLLSVEPKPWGALPEPFFRTLDFGYRYWLAAQFPIRMRSLVAACAEVAS